MNDMNDAGRRTGIIRTHEELIEEMTGLMPIGLAEHILGETVSVAVGNDRYYDSRTVTQKTDEMLEKLAPKPGLQEKNGKEPVVSDEDFRAERQELKMRIETLERQLADIRNQEEQNLCSLRNSLSEREAELTELRKKLLKADESMKKETSGRIEAQNTAACLQKKLADEEKNHTRIVTGLNGKISDLETKLASRNVKGDVMSGTSTSKAGLKKELRDANRQIADLTAELNGKNAETGALREENRKLKEGSGTKMLSELSMKNRSLEDLLERRNDDYALLEKKLEEKDSRISSVMAELRASEQKVSRLQDALNATKDSGEKKAPSAPSYDNELYAGEISDFIGYLARLRLEALPDEDVTCYRRERELCTVLSGIHPDSGFQKNLADDIQDAVRMKFDKRSNAGLASLGFTPVSSNSHDKFVLEIDGRPCERIALVMPKTPSDRKARLEATSCLIRMLTFGTSSSGGEK